MKMILQTNQILIVQLHEDEMGYSICYWAY